ncbi:MAG: hypothetical protein M3N54_08500 [Acidobacteriota bacterium]|nr:hypothetical protein [Acidobacteriota bacterium]
MRSLRTWLTALLFGAVLLAQRPWQQLTLPSVREAAANFKTPPREYGAIHWALWGGELTKERIVSEFDQLVANGVYIVNFGPSQKMNPKYLSPEHIALTKFAVEEAAKRGMKVWLADEGSYPSGFAGGKIGTDYPQLTMQGIDADIRINVMPGQTLTMPTPPDTLGALMVHPQTGATALVPIDPKQIKWTAPAPPPGAGGAPQPWQLLLVRHMFRSSPTRYINRADGSNAKDSLYPLIDYLNPDATRAFLKTTHEVYKEQFGNEFGRTVLGFFGDEPDYTGFMPWTPKLPEEFRAKKGYDLVPYLPLLFAPKMTDEAWRVKADYYDVWSGMFRDNFFGVQAEWCARNNMEYLVHLNHEELGLRFSSPEDLIRNEGDYFRDNRYVQVPGIDNLSQLVPAAIHTADAEWNVNNNFPKLASSAAHLFGRPKVWSEEGGGPGVDGKYQLDFQLVRGVTAMQIRIPVGRGGGGGPAASGPLPPQAAMIAAYTNRAGYLMSIGRPAAQVGLYHPASSMWMGSEEADRSTTKLGWQLLQHQIDWDYFDEQSLASVASIEGGGFKNLSGQVYRAIVFPSTVVISKVGLERLRAFTKAGGKAIFVGKTPNLVVDRTFLDAKEIPDLSFATLIEPSGDITARVLAALPAPDFKLDGACPNCTYTHRSLRDGELYFVLNEGSTREQHNLTLSGTGPAQVWDLGAGAIRMLPAASPLVLEPYEAKVIVMGPAPPGAAPAEPVLTNATALMDLAGLGTSGGHTQFNAPAAQAGKRVYLDLGSVHDYAHVRLNGKDLEPRAWPPYRWDVTGALRSGSNDLDVEILVTAAGRGPGGRGGGTPQISGLIGPVRLVSQ